jgi:hypothetical protein
MITNLTQRKMKTKLIIAVGIAAIIVIGIGSHAAYASKVSKTSFQDGYNAGFAAGTKDRINGNEFDSKPPKGHSDVYDEGYRRGYNDGWFEEHFSSNPVAAASSSSSAAAGGGGSAASSSSSAAGGGSAAASSSSSASS